MEIIKNEAVVSDPYRQIPDSTPLPPPSEDVIVSLSRFRAERDTLIARSGRLGVRVPGDLDPGEIEDDLRHLDVIAIELPKFTDGRAFSTGRLLRERLGYEGEIRAVGHFIRDQIFYLHRVGFDAFQLPEGRDPHDGLAAFRELTVQYQPAVDHQEPSFRR
jgi:uncharacterized protein (DUF934 family)